ncbi:arabinofuranosyltransferase [Dietzia sp. 179-F 9C3 NHS]|uniref:arabinofuranosyltransferase n=1 Tax=Dietzia sp. 179-F 9C3 NHS TaxID=3374295 RepID=UPI003879AEF2
MTGARLLIRRGTELLAALVVATLVGGLTLAAVDRLSFAQPSWLPRAFGATLAAGFVALAGWLLLRRGRDGRGTDERGLWLLGTAGPAFLAAGHLGLVLHGTPHYLFGLGGDQLNRVAYVTRFADSPALDDVFYADAAPFYPPQWFWVGGRLAALAGVDGWEFYKPYAIVTMAIAGAIAFVAWRWLVPARIAALLGLATSVVGVHTNAYEPYSWILICLLPQVVVATLLLCGRVRSGRDGAPGEGVGADPGPTWPLVVTISVYLGWAALGYTLIAGFAALVAGLVVVGAAWLSRADRGVAVALLAHLAAVAAISAALALVFWHRFLLAVLGGAGTEPSVAYDFAPESATRWPLPMFEPSATGVLSLLGLVWILATVWPRGAGRVAGWGAESVRHRVGPAGTVRDDDEVASLPADRALVIARALAVLVAASFGWFVLSGLRAVTGSTLLPFRMIPVVGLALALAGVLGGLALARWAVATTPRPSRGRVRAVAVVLAGLAAVQSVQHVSEEDAQFAAVARAQSPVPHGVLGAIDAMTPGRGPSDLVVVTADHTLYAYRPYFTFQAPAQAYAAPTGRYEERLDQLRRWAAAAGPAELTAALDSGPFRAPDVFVLDRADGGWLTLPVLVNVMPLEHNNETEQIRFAPRQFADPTLFDVREVGSRVVIVRR